MAAQGADISGHYHLHQEPAHQQQTPTAVAAQGADIPGHYHLHHLPYVVEGLNKQIFITGQLLAAYAKVNPTMESCIHYMYYMQQQQERQEKELHDLARTITKLDERIQEWETTYLAEIIDRLLLHQRYPIPPTPVTPCSPACSEVNEEQTARHQDTEEHDTTQEYADTDQHEDVTGVLHALGRQEP